MEHSASNDLGGGQLWRIRAGDCISLIARETGHFWETVWNHSNNAEIRRNTGNPNVLPEGASVFVPDPAVKAEDRQTLARHRFRRRGEPATLNIQIIDGGEARRNERFELRVEGHTIRGTTDDRGFVRVGIPGNCLGGILSVGEGENLWETEIHLGELSVSDEVRGVQERLLNLGFGCPITGEMDARTWVALLAFCKARNLPEPTELTAELRREVEQSHGS